ncbi:MAG: hypothetical protein HY331_04540 [Chloroflexi bacterium]|nr:hypothetical protein [Chloroflexota bacterium]
MAEDRASGSVEIIAEAMAKTLEARHAGRFTVEEIATIRTRIGRYLAAADKLREYRLSNADEPDLVFMPYRREE